MDVCARDGGAGGGGGGRELGVRSLGSPMLHGSLKNVWFSHIMPYLTCCII